MAPSRIPLFLRSTLAILIASVVFGSFASAQTNATAQLPPLKQLTIEELLQVDVTLPLRRDSPVREAPSAISVLTAEDIRRSGAVSLPEVLRQVPGLFVARFNAASWIVTARGFASNAANKMLVMIDGRSVYSPLFSGVFWEQQDTDLLDLDRIEVVHGPGGTLWGSNAVNGTINVVSKPAAQTQGTLLTVGGGSEEHLSTSLRYGGRIGTGHFRVYGKYFDRDAAHLADGTSSGDAQRSGMGGFRFDFGEAAQSFMIKGDVYRTSVGLLDRDDIEGDGVNVLARWTRRPDSSSELQLSAYVDHSARQVPAQFSETRNTVDVDLQHRLTIGTRHSVGWGASYRRSADDTVPTPLVAFDPEDRATNLFAAFVQGDLALTTSLSAITGVKIERNDYTGVEAQPTARLRWTPTVAHTVWGGVSRAIRMPTRLDTDVRVRAGNQLLISGNPDFESETLIATEAGYRGNHGGRVAWDLVIFHHDYDDIRTQEAGVPVIVGNGLNVTTDGATASVTVQPRPAVRVTGSYAFLAYEPVLDQTSRDINQGLQETIDPEHQVLVLGRFNLPRAVELDLTARYVSELPTPGTPAYTEAGFRVGWRLTRHLEIAVIGRDILHADHFEFISPTSAQRTRLERALYTRATVAF